MKRFAGKVAFVTGGGSGIGRACCAQLGAEGARVAVVDIAGESATATASAITAGGGTAIALGADVSKPGQVEQAVAEAVDRLGGVDILINSVVWGVRKKFVELTLDDWYKSIDGCLNTYFLCIKFCVPEMIKAGGGKIVSIASIAGHVGYGAPAYTAAKGGILAMTRELAGEFAPHRININSVSPGVIRTGLNVDTLADPDIRDRTIALTPWGRLGQPEDVAAAAVFLASPQADYVTGADLIVDGAMSCTIAWGAVGGKFRSFHASR
jgi:NAD(P)-dependent dehydrogenase (short-subunit alcohol dehydrogenase family)